MKVEKSQILEKVYEQNMKRLLIFSSIAVPIILGQLLIFYFKNTQPGTVEYKWFKAIVLLNFTLLAISFVVGVFALYYRIKGKPRIGIGNIVIKSFYILALLVGVATVVTDQLVTPAITPFLLICVIVAVAFLIDPKYSVVFFALGYLLFFFTLPITQDNAAHLLSNRVNGLTSVGVAFFLSLVLWRNTTEKYRQSIVIDQQRENLLVKNRELVEQSNELKKAISIKNKLFSVIGHDLKSPLVAMPGLIDFLEKGIEEKDVDKSKDLTKVIKSGLNQTLNLLYNLLDWSKTQSQDRGVNLEHVNIESITQGALSFVEASAHQKNIIIKQQINASHITVDVNIIKTVIRNLLCNAIKYSYEGSVIEIVVNENDDHTVFAIKDSGVGLTDKQKQGLFSGNPEHIRMGTKKEKGTGLGLIICKDFIELHGGKLWVESEVDKGSTFSFSIPKKTL